MAMMGLISNIMSIITKLISISISVTWNNAMLLVLDLVSNKMTCPCQGLLGFLVIAPSDPFSWDAFQGYNFDIELLAYS